MVHYAWVNDIGFNPELFKESLKNTKLFKSLPEEDLENKSNELCLQADFALLMFRSTFELKKLPIKE